MVTAKFSQIEGGIIGVRVTFSQSRKHPSDKAPKVKRSITVGVFHGSGPCGPMVKATVNSRRPVVSKNSPSQSNCRKGDFLLGGSIESIGKASGSLIMQNSVFSSSASGSETLGTNIQASPVTSTYSPANAMNGAFQLNSRAKAPEPRPPIMVAAGVPIRKEEKTIFLRREGVGYTRLKMPTAIGTFAAQAMPVSPDTTSSTIPLLEKVVHVVSRQNATKLKIKRVFRGITAQVSAM